MLSLSTPDSSLLARSTPFVRLLSEAAAEIGVSLEMDGEYGFVGRLVDKDGRSYPIFGKSLGLNSDAAAHLAADKDYTARWLAADGLPTPNGQLVFSSIYRARMALRNAETAARLPGKSVAAGFGEKHGWPVILKPNTGSEGRDIRLCTNAEHLAIELDRAFLDILGDGERRHHPTRFELQKRLAGPCRQVAIPGRVNEFELTIEKPGIYGGQCAEFCGLAHGDMFFSVNAMEPGSGSVNSRTWSRVRIGRAHV